MVVFVLLRRAYSRVFVLLGEADHSVCVQYIHERESCAASAGPHLVAAITPGQQSGRHQQLHRDGPPQLHPVQHQRDPASQRPKVAYLICLKLEHIIFFEKGWLRAWRLRSRSASFWVFMVFCRRGKTLLFLFNRYLKQLNNLLPGWRLRRNKFLTAFGTLDGCRIL